MKKISLTINGRQQEVVAGSDKVLLELLREDLKLTGAKQSCDRKGQCGACMVIVNGKAVRSCLTKVTSLNGADVITVEGLGTPANPHLIQEAFVLSGAIQCGFCTPGMIMAAKVLLDANPDPSTEEIKQALRHNICRCTGYKKIIDAVKLAGQFLRGETTPDEVRPKPSDGMIGVSHPRPSSMAKACGTSHFTSDIKIDGAAEMAVLRSDVPHALIKSIDYSEAEKMEGVLGIITSKDIKGTNRLKLLVADRPVLCEDRVRYIGDPIAAVAAFTREQALAAVQAIKVDLEPLPVLKNPEESLAEGAPQIHANIPNLCFSQPQIKGDAEAALAKSAAVIEAEFTTQLNHQAAIEPEACVAFFEEEEDEDEQKLVIIGRSINIHLHMSVLQEALGWENMRYLEAYAGGQFGMKIEITSEAVTGAMAIHLQRAVRYIPSLDESMKLTPKRHPFTMKVKLAADSDGKLTAYCNDFVVDNGAYNSIGHVVVNRSFYMLSGSYNIPNVQAMARLVYTNNPFGAAARGAGPPQVNFALECAMEMLADKMGIDPFEFRVKNFLQPGQSKSTGRVVEEWPIEGLMDAIRPDYERARREAAENKNGKIKRGVGLGTGSFGIGGPGDTGICAVELDPDGGVSVYAAAADPGEGNDSMFTQIAAHVMNIPLNKVRLNNRDTDVTTATGPAAGSRITYMVGGAMVNALEELKKVMAETGAKNGDELKAAGKPTRYLGTKKNEDAGPLDPKTGQGPSFQSQVHAVQLAEIEVDTETGDVRIIKMTTAVDAGPIIHPQNLEGQLEGGMDQGAGYALREEFVAGQTKDWKTFKFPTFKTYFDMDIITRETPRIHGTLGSVGVGEMTLVPTAPAIINAIKDATGAWVLQLPATPEKVKQALKSVS